MRSKTRQTLAQIRDRLAEVCVGFDAAISLMLERETVLRDQRNRWIKIALINDMSLPNKIVMEEKLKAEIREFDAQVPEWEDGE